MSKMAKNNDIIENLSKLINSLENGSYDKAHVNVEPCLSDLELMAVARLSYEAAVSFDKLSMTSFRNPEWDSLLNGDKSEMALCVMSVHRHIVNPYDGDAAAPVGQAIEIPVPHLYFHNDSKVVFGDISTRVFIQVAKVFVNEFRRKRSQYVFGNGKGYHDQYPGIDGEKDKV